LLGRGVYDGPIPLAEDSYRARARARACVSLSVIKHNSSLNTYSEEVERGQTKKERKKERKNNIARILTIMKLLIK